MANSPGLKIKTTAGRQRPNGSSGFKMGGNGPERVAVGKGRQGKKHVGCIASSTNS